MTGVCEQCGRTFEVPEATQEAYPGWTPPKCGDCFRGSSRGRPGRGASGRGSGGRGGGGGEEHLTIAEVLERYHDGPDDGVFTDGSAIPNPGPGGWGAVYVVDGDVVAQDHGHVGGTTTNNRMELTAIIQGIALVPEGRGAVLHTDSRLAVDTLTTWAAGWERRGWRRKSGPVENLDLVKEAYHLVTARPEIELRWVKAHAGNRWNEYADSLATAWARDEL